MDWSREKGYQLGRLNLDNSTGGSSPRVEIDQNTDLSLR